LLLICRNFCHTRETLQVDTVADEQELYADRLTIGTVFNAARLVEVDPAGVVAAAEADVDSIRLLRDGLAPWSCVEVCHSDYEGT